MYLTFQIGLAENSMFWVSLNSASPNRVGSFLGLLKNKFNLWMREKCCEKEKFLYNIVLGSLFRQFINPK